MNYVVRSLVLCLCFLFGQAYEVCSSGTFTYKYCEDGYYCCNDDRSCCSETIFLSIGAIVGICIGGIVFIACIITCICMAYDSSKKKHGTVVAPAGQTHVSTFSYNVQPVTHQQPGQVVMPAPAGHPSTGHQPFGYGNTMVMYPPPANAAPPPYGQAGGMQPVLPGAYGPSGAAGSNPPQSTKLADPTPGNE